MKIAVALCWFDEPPAFLERCAASLAGFADTLVSLDGRWLLFGDDGDAVSPAAQHDALHAGADAAAIEHIALAHDGDTFPSQVVKRDRLYREAIEETGCDWLFVIDGDEYVREHSPELRDALAATEHDVALVRCVRMHAQLRTRERLPRRFFRASEIAGVEETHNGIRTHDGRWLTGPRRVAHEVAADLSHLLELNHDVQARGGRRNRAQRNYYDQRRVHRVEVF